MPNGGFTVKGAYQRITEGRSISSIGTPELWNCIWKKGRVVPRVRLFIWKVVRNGLPLNKTIASRTSRGEPDCASCCQNNEDSTHLLFTCPFARSCWYASPLPIRSDSLPTDGTVSTALLNLSLLLKNEDWGVALNICWAIWRCRNDKAYPGIAPTHQQFTKYLNCISRETKIALPGTKFQPQSQKERYEHQALGFSCMVDGSWINTWCGGLGFVLIEVEELRVAKSKGTKACCPIQAEAIALLEAVRYVVGAGVSGCKFYTDNEALANLSMALQPPMQADWRAFNEIMEVWRVFKQNNHYSCQYFPRCHNEMADKLAKEGSRRNWDFETFTYPILNFGN